MKSGAGNLLLRPAIDCSLRLLFDLNKIKTKLSQSNFVFQFKEVIFVLANNQKIR